MQDEKLRAAIMPHEAIELNVKDADGSRHKYNLKVAYDLNAICLVEELTGKNLLIGLTAFLDKPSVHDIRALFYAGLLLNHPEFTGQHGLQVIGTWVTLANAKHVWATCIKAFKSQLPEEEQAKLNPPPATAS